MNAYEFAWQQLLEDAARLEPDPELADRSTDQLEHDLRTGAAQLAALTCRWLGLVAEFVIRGEWARRGARTPAEWLSWAVGVAPATAREQVRVALRLRELPEVRARFETIIRTFRRTGDRPDRAGPTPGLEVIPLDDGLAEVRLRTRRHLRTRPPPARAAGRRRRGDRRHPRPPHPGHGGPPRPARPGRHRPRPAPRHVPTRATPAHLRRRRAHHHHRRPRHPPRRRPRLPRRHLHAHHVIEWTDDGPTDLDNLILLCSYHHRFVHDHHDPHALQPPWWYGDYDLDLAIAVLQEQTRDLATAA